MSGAPAHRLYSTEVLGLAVSLADYPFDEDAPLHGEARSQTCGSHLQMSLAADEQGAITDLGLRVSACAIGQAAAAIFAGGAHGGDRTHYRQSLDAIEQWLAGPPAPMPDWPGLTALEEARAYPARHNAILLPWKAALAALSKDSQSG